MNFGHFLAAAQKGEPKRVTWICGSSPTLREEVRDRLLDMIQALTPGLPLELVRFFASEVDPGEIWAQVNQYSFDPQQRRAIVIREAEQISDWEPLRRFLEASRQLPNTHVILLADEPGIRRIKNPKGEIVYSAPADFIQEKVSSARQYELSKTKAEDLIYWVRWRTRLSDELATYLVERAGNEPEDIAAVIKLENALTPELNRAWVEAVTTERAAEKFSYHLIRNEKDQALKGFPRDIVSTLGELGDQLEILEYLHPLLKLEYPFGRILEDKRYNLAQAKELLEIAKHYPPEEIRRRRELLVELDDVAQLQPRAVGLASTLLSLW